MTAPHIVDPAGLLGEALSDASPDLMRSLLQTVINALLSADAEAVVGAEWGKPTPTRSAQRNGYRHRDLDTRIGTIDVAVPKLRTGTYFPEWLLERRKRAEFLRIRGLFRGGPEIEPKSNQDRPNGWGSRFRAFAAVRTPGARWLGGRPAARGPPQPPRTPFKELESVTTSSMMCLTDWPRRRAIN